MTNEQIIARLKYLSMTEQEAAMQHELQQLLETDGPGRLFDILQAGIEDLMQQLDEVGERCAWSMAGDVIARAKQVSSSS